MKRTIPATAAPLTANLAARHHAICIGRIAVLLLTACVAQLSAAASSPPAAQNTASDHAINAVADVAHQFTFYFDGRFGRTYLTPIGGRHTQLWATLASADLEKYNLLVIEHDNSPCPYTDADVARVDRFVRAGGGLMMIGRHMLARGKTEFQMNRLARHFECQFIDQKPSGTLRWAVDETNNVFPSGTPEHVDGRAAGTVRCKDRAGWTPLLIDASGQAVAAAREFHNGRIVAVHGDGLFGDKPDDGQAVNTPQTRAILRWLSANRTVDPQTPLRRIEPELEKEVGGLRVQYPSYLESYADAITELYFQVHDELRELTGVPLSQGMNKKLILISTGGGGFSSGVAIGIGAFWGGFPENKFGMTELIGHEATHSWVLPFGEPMWNEGIATYLGIEVGRRLGHEKEAEAARKRWTDACRRFDPDCTKIDISQAEDRKLHGVYMGKPMWIWDRLREKYGHDLLARYFQAKRWLIRKDQRTKYTADDCVAVLSLAAGEDLFAWFNSLGISVSRDRAQIRMALPLVV